jgi:hypothetical protein
LIKVPRNSMGENSFSTNGTEITEYPYAKQWN